jgi:cell wall-associated NlpC family hydrolase
MRMILRGKRKHLVAATLTLISFSALLVAVSPVAQAAQSITAVQGQVTSLQIQASAIAEAAQQSQVDLIALTRSLNSVQAKDSVQTSSLTALKKSIGILAAEQYKNGFLGQGMTLMFSSDPTQYLNSAQSLSVVETQNAIKIRKFSAADIALKSTALTLNQKVALVAAAKARYVSQEVSAQAKLSQAQKLLRGLTKSQRAHLKALQASQDNSYQKKSLVLAKGKIGAKGAAAIALRYALRQLGSPYLFGASGIQYWDCSGLTMRALQQAGISLPHSAAAQTSYGKSIPFSQVRPGDLVFFGQPISHVGIYFGGGKMIDAPHSGARVRIEDFGFWFGNIRFVAARRF